MISLIHNINKSLKFHHTGVLVNNLQESILNYSLLFGAQAISKIHDIKSQQITVCFVKISDDVYLELIQPNEGNTNFDKFFKKGINFYHIGFKCFDFEKTFENLLKNDFRHISTLCSEAFDNKRCAFFMSNELHVIEIIEE